MRHLKGFVFIALLVLVFGGGPAFGTNEDLTKEGVSGISYGRVTCPECGFDFKAAIKEPVSDLAEEGTSAISYGRVKCTKCGFEFKTPVNESVTDLSEEGTSAISYGRVKCTKCGFDFTAQD